MDDKPLRVHGVPEPQGQSWLKEVRIDATRNAIENLRRQKEKREFEEAKARGITAEEIIHKGKEDLGLETPASVGPSEQEVKPKKSLNQLNKGELLELANEEGVVVDESQTNAELVEAIKAHREEEK